MTTAWSIAKQKSDESLRPQQPLNSRSRSKYRAPAVVGAQQMVEFSAEAKNGDSPMLLWVQGTRLFSLWCTLHPDLSPQDAWKALNRKCQSVKNGEGGFEKTKDMEDILQRQFKEYCQTYFRRNTVEVMRKVQAVPDPKRPTERVIDGLCYFPPDGDVLEASVCTLLDQVTLFCLPGKTKKLLQAYPEHMGKAGDVEDTVYQKLLYRHVAKKRTDDTDQREVLTREEPLADSSVNLIAWRRLAQKAISSSAFKRSLGRVLRMEDRFWRKCAGLVTVHEAQFLHNPFKPKKEALGLSKTIVRDPEEDLSGLYEDYGNEESVILKSVAILQRFALGMDKVMEQFKERAKKDLEGMNSFATKDQVEARPRGKTASHALAVKLGSITIKCPSGAEKEKTDVYCWNVLFNPVKLPDREEDILGYALDYLFETWGNNGCFEKPERQVLFPDSDDDEEKAIDYALTNSDSIICGYFFEDGSDSDLNHFQMVYEEAKKDHDKFKAKVTELTLKKAKDDLKHFKKLEEGHRHLSSIVSIFKDLSTTANKEVLYTNTDRGARRIAFKRDYWPKLKEAFEHYTKAIEIGDKLTAYLETEETRGEKRGPWLEKITYDPPSNKVEWLIQYPGSVWQKKMSEKYLLIKEVCERVAAECGSRGYRKRIPITGYPFPDYFNSYIYMVLENLKFHDPITMGPTVQWSIKVLNWWLNSLIAGQVLNVCLAFYEVACILDDNGKCTIKSVPTSDESSSEMQHRISMVQASLVETEKAVKSVKWKQFLKIVKAFKTSLNGFEHDYVQKYFDSLDSKEEERVYNAEHVARGQQQNHEDGTDQQRIAEDTAEETNPTNGDTTVDLSNQGEDQPERGEDETQTSEASRVLLGLRNQASPTPDSTTTMQQQAEEVSPTRDSTTADQMVQEAQLLLDVRATANLVPPTPPDN